MSFSGKASVTSLRKHLQLSERSTPPTLLTPNDPIGITYVFDWDFKPKAWSLKDGCLLGREGVPCSGVCVFLCVCVYVCVLVLLPSVSCTWSRRTGKCKWAVQQKSCLSALYSTVTDVCYFLPSRGGSGLRFFFVVLCFQWIVFTLRIVLRHSVLNNY